MEFKTLYFGVMGAIGVDMAFSGHIILLTMMFW